MSVNTYGLLRLFSLWPLALSLSLSPQTTHFGLLRLASSGATYIYWLTFLELLYIYIYIESVDKLSDSSGRDPSASSPVSDKF